MKITLRNNCVALLFDILLVTKLKSSGKRKKAATHKDNSLRPNSCLLTNLPLTDQLILVIGHGRCGNFEIKLWIID